MFHKLPKHLDREESQNAHADVFEALRWVLAEIRHLHEVIGLTVKSESGWHWLKTEPPPVPTDLAPFSTQYLI